MREEIDPKLEKLRGEKRSYLEYQKATSELERLTRLVKAYEWVLAVDKVKKAEENLQAKKADIERAREDVERGGREVTGMEKELEEIHRRREKVCVVGYHDWDMLVVLQVEKLTTCRSWPKVARSRR